MDQNRESIDLIKEKLDIAAYIEKYVPLKNAGRNLMGKCPFHEEKTPSFSVSTEYQMYKCFGCGKSGDIFTFVQEIEHIDFPETLQRLAKEAGVEITKKKTNTLYTKINEINRHAANYYYSQLQASSIAKKYIEERGFTDETVKEFGVGYAPKSYGLKAYLKKSMKVTEKELELSGLFTNKNGTQRDKFKDRIMFPIRSKAGKVIAFSGRVLPGNDYGPKYLNSPETPVFKKKDGLYGIYESRQAIRKDSLGILCEGQTDVISAHQAGYKNIVAPLGTGITIEQIQLLGSLTKDILLLFDSDEAGLKATERAFLIATKQGIQPYAATPSPFKDLDELILKDKDKLQKVIDEKLDAFTFLITEKINSLDTSKKDDYNEMIKYVRFLLGSVTDEADKQFYIDKAIKITAFNPEVFKAHSATADQVRNVPRETVAKKNDIESMYLEEIFRTEGFSIPKEHDLEHFTFVATQKVLERMRSGATTEELTERYGDAIKDRIIKANNGEALGEEYLESLYARIVKRSLKRKLAKLRQELTIAEERGEDKDLNKLLTQISELSTQLKN